MLQADAYVGFGTVPLFANALAELTAAVRSCTERGMRVVVTAPSQDLRNELAAIDTHLVEAREFVKLSASAPLLQDRDHPCGSGDGACIAQRRRTPRAHPSGHAEPASDGGGM